MPKTHSHHGWIICEEEEEEEEVEKEEEEKVRRQRASEPRRICFVLDGTQKITRNSRSHLGQGLVKYCSRFETFARSANASLEKSHETRKPAKQVGLPIQKRREYREWDGVGFIEYEQTNLLTLYVC